MPPAHEHPEIEHLLPAELDGVGLRLESLSADGFGLDDDLAAQLGVDPQRAAFAFGSVTRGPLILVAIGVLPGVAQATIEREYIGREFPGTRRMVGGVLATVQVGPGGPSARATWATDERLFMVSTRTERALPRFVRAVVALPHPPVVTKPRDRGLVSDPPTSMAAEFAELSTPRTGQERERGLAALSLAFSSDADARDALRAVLVSDPVPEVRFMAAQSLLMHEHRDHESFPAIAALIRDLVASGERASIALVPNTALLLSQYLTHARLGFAPMAADEEVAAAVDAVRDAWASPAGRRGDAAALENIERVLLEGSPVADVRSFGDPGRVDGPCPIPADLAGGPMEIARGSATDWADRRVNRAIRALDRRPRDITVWAAHPMHGPGLMVDAYVVPGCSAEELAVAFADAFFRPAKGPWQAIEVDGHQVHRQAWVRDGASGTVAWWSSPGLVVRLVGDDPDVMGAIGRFPSPGAGPA